ncbi:MAG TPA: NADPH:quinone oxidoreductase family protein [Stellaceae bacterium]|nr:NADPH:quinone oxidoreductase family protein [Stellaceae bacterium]
MKAVICRAHGPPEGLQLEEWPVPEPGPGQVAIAVHASGINFADLLVVSGGYQRLPPLPFIPGKEVAGIVAAVGPGVAAFAPGDRVLAEIEHGGFAEIALAPALQCYALPDAVSFVDAAAMGIVYQTAHFALVARGQYRTGETVLVTGAGGGVGMASVQLAKALGAKVIACVSRPERAALARQDGADHVVITGRPDLRDALRDEVRRATDGHMADIALDSVGGDVFDAALRAVAWEGRLVVIGFAAGRIPTLKANYLLLKNIAVLGLQWTDYRDGTPERVREVQRELFALRIAGRIRPHVAACLPLARFDAALARLARGEVLGKIVLTVGSDE